MGAGYLKTLRPLLPDTCSYLSQEQTRPQYSTVPRPFLLLVATFKSTLRFSPSLVSASPAERPALYSDIRAREVELPSLLCSSGGKTSFPALPPPTYLLSLSTFLKAFNVSVSCCHYSLGTPANFSMSPLWFPDIFHRPSCLLRVLLLIAETASKNNRHEEVTKVIISFFLATADKR